MINRHLLILLVLSVVSVWNSLSQNIYENKEKVTPAKEVFNVDSVLTREDSVNLTQMKKKLPKLESPEYVITGLASVNLPGIQKHIADEIIAPEAISRDAFRANVGDKSYKPTGKDKGPGLIEGTNKYKGFFHAGMGTYFTPECELQLGSNIYDIDYTIGGHYFLTNGYAENTKRSQGGFKMKGSKHIPSYTEYTWLNDAVLKCVLEYSSKSYNFYGSASPYIRRTISDFQIDFGIENYTYNTFPYLMLLTLGNSNVTDSSSAKNETRFGLKGQTIFEVSDLPLSLNMDLSFASGGLGFADINGGVMNYNYLGLDLKGILHLYWAKGMLGQNITRLYPELSLSYQLSIHKIYMIFNPSIKKNLLFTMQAQNGYLSSNSIIKSLDIHNAGEFVVESKWSESILTRASLAVKSVKNYPLFSDSLSRGVWSVIYEGQTKILSFGAEMVAKFNSNDYFEISAKFNSVKNTDFSVPYVPDAEIGSSACVRILRKLGIGFNSRFLGKRVTDLQGRSALSEFALVNVWMDYSPFDFMKCMIEGRNILDADYELWKGYKEFPMTINFSINLKW